MRRFFAVLLGCVAALAFIPAGVANAEGKTPVVFVHGYTGSTSNWVTAMGAFRVAGYSDDELYSYEYNWALSNERSAAGLADFVEEVRADTGSDQVDIVNHSMGGLVSRWYLKELGGTEHVAHWASLAGANHGTTSAGACTVNASCREMLPGSSFERQLNSGEEAPGETSYATWYSPCDGVILPYESTAVDGAQNTVVPCETHIGFLGNTDVLAEVVDYFA
ncbi:lipase [Saccharopolyspora sp. NFXS83]|uniref:esterase/lipase family protein n=1 Tax=Saccharopolyspora sp. NFXS83 TaxID=2993560 RepID=UPI00224B4B5B|nr:alpha/beta fold hydrolase [Saccharopolyspora sp. NFXS83]MCX2734371.1 lipase [Saccharopolyspora sp. NFXS83]